ncbi:hypothetical protein ACHAXH_005374, partial [Discostella pseudostelligera]
MASSFRSRLTRRQADPSAASPSSTSAVSAASGVASSGGGGGHGISSFLGRRSVGSVGGGKGKGGTNNHRQSKHSQTGYHHLASSSSSHASINPLATFDACIEACDALAASAASSSWQRQNQHHHGSISNSTTQVDSKDTSDNDEDNNNSNLSSTENEQGSLVHDAKPLPSSTSNETEEIQNNAAEVALVPDCSVLVSPDGALLFTSSLSTMVNPSNSTKLRNNDNGNAPDNHQEEADQVVGVVGHPTTTNNNKDRYPWTKISHENCDGAILSEEYESAIITGNDLTPNGDYDSNGFTSTGWDIDATTCALSASRDVLAGMTNFVETLATIRKQEAVCVRAAVETLGDVRIQLERNWYVRRRLGPMMMSNETKLSKAIEAMEGYYVQISEDEMERWRMACSSGSNSSLAAKSSTSMEGKAADDDTRRLNPPELIHGILPKLQTASIKATTRTSEREHALSDMRSKISECETILREQKVWASNQWKRVAEEESNINRLYAIKKMEQHEFYEDQRRRRLLEREQEEEDAFVHHSTSEGMGDRIEEEEPLSREVWEMVQNVNTSMEDFGHTGYSPRVVSRKAEGDGSVSSPHRRHHQQQQLRQEQQSLDVPSKIITRADVERESEIQDLKMVAQAADEAVEDAAGKLLNIMSKGDTTLRSARLAAESCLLSECNAARNCLRALVAMERASLQDRLQQLDVLEAAVDAIAVREDIDSYIRADKAIPGGRSRDGEDDGGGIAAALAVLNSHGESSGSANSPRKYRNIERPSYYEGWSESGCGEEGDDEDDVEPALFGEVINMLFADSPTSNPVKENSDYQCIGSESGPARQILNDSKIEIASNALRSKQGNNHRKSILYELNNQRSKKTWVEGRANFDALCHIFDAFLSGCGREPSDVSNAMMLMILSQTFYIVDHAGEEEINNRKDYVDGARRDRQ